MNRIIKNSSAPILTGFALTIMFILSSAFNTAYADIVAFNGNDFSKVSATNTFRVVNSGYDWAARSSASTTNFYFVEGGFGSADRYNFREADFVDFSATNFSRFEFDPFDVDNNRFADIARKNFFPLATSRPHTI